MKRSGTADLPLHGGRVPPWLASRMAAMGAAISQAVIHEYGRAAFLSRMSDPFWFQALGCVMGMDWHSSGITTSVMGALKRGLAPMSRELGIYICGGRGRHSRKTPAELTALSNTLGLDGDGLVRASKLSAKVDNTCVQDGFSLYLHSFVLSLEGEWAVVQQGMNQDTGMARRYHWHSPSVTSFVSDPQAAIAGIHQGTIINVSDGRADKARQAIVSFLQEHPERQGRELRHLSMPDRHGVRAADVNSKRLGAVLALAYENQFKDFADNLLLPGLGPRAMQSLALVSEVVYGAPSRFSDPARFSFAHGGKDGAPFPVPLDIYDTSIKTLKTAVEKAKIGQSEKLQGLKTLSRFSRYIEQHHSPDSDVEAVIRKERRESHLYGGRTIKGPAQPPKQPQQLSLFKVP
ncbi:MAG: DUF763 domain-containing protein [Deltaproteobacteria bacterium]|nr:DUF763 domain-containing protein [Deltaproteobacteria bacterium]